MYFKRIELNGFKSFADPVTIEFSDGITCIVGPNGSGKSNISDAIRWVLGEQSPKTLRGGKMEEVIFAGTQNRKPKGMAEVTLVIDNTNHTLPIDFAEVGITRRMYRSGESEYMINHSPCRLRDIRELIMDTGIGVEGYSIIGQGKISDIIDNKMDSRREIFEEAAGVTKYRARKSDAEKKLSNAGLNLDRVNDILGEIEGRIGGLEEDSRKAAEYLDIRQKYQDVEINIILKNIEAAEEKRKAVAEEMVQLEKDVDEAMAVRDRLDEQLRVQRDRGEELDAELSGSRQRLQSLSDEIHRLSSSRELNMERRASLEREKARLEEEILAQDEKLQREETNLHELETARDEAQQQLDQCRGILAEKSALFQQAIDNEAAAVEASENKKDRIFDIGGEISAQNAEIKSLEGMKQALEVRKQKVLEDGDRSDESDLQLKNRKEAAAQRLVFLEEKIKRCAADLAQAKRKEGEAILRQKESADRLGQLQVNEGRLTSRAKLLEELENTYEGYSGGVRFLMKQPLAGIIGTVGDLIRVPKGWELAIETELGNKMQNIVCRKDKDARRAIDLLKENKAGRVTFLPIETLRVQPTPDPDFLRSEPGFLGIGAEEVTATEDCGGVIDYLLDRVIVVDNIDHALSMSAKNRGPFRFVTLEGEIINAAGAITGGSLKSNTGNILSRKTEQNEIENDLRLVRKEIRIETSIRDQAQDAVDKARSEVAALQDADRAAGTDKALTESELQQIEKMEAESRETGSRRSRELAELDAETARIDGQIEGVREKIRALEEERTQAEEDVAKAGEMLAACRVAYEDARTAETEAQMAENTAQERLSATGNLVAAAAARCREVKAEKKLRQAAFDNVEHQIAGMSDTSEEAGERLQTMKNEQAALDETIKLRDAERKEVLVASQKTEEERSQQERVLYDRQLKKHDAEQRQTRFDGQTEALKEKLWEEFEMSFAQALDYEKEDFVMSRALKESREYKERLRALGDVNVGAIEEYRQVKERYDFLTAQKSDIVRAMDQLTAVIADMDQTIRRQYKESFDRVVENFEGIFAELFGGGSACLTMDDPDNPLESGVEIEVQPPGKKLQNMNLLSGGEKTMTAIALMFAVLKAKPTPFCILDEVEAALDDANIDRFADYLKNFGDTQFALVTHQKVTMEHAASLYGVTMPERGVSRILSLKLEDSPAI